MSKELTKNEKLIKRLKGTSEIEFNDLKNVISYKQALKTKNSYFCCGLGEKLNKRCLDDDIKTKKYFIVDIDIRLDHYEKTGDIVTQEFIHDKGLEIVELLNKAEYGDYCGFVDSGNGVHIYYSGEERSFNKKVYSNGVSNIFEEIDEIIKETGFKCDKAVHNIGRITRLPGSINPRKKIRDKKVLWDLGDVVCETLGFFEEDSVFFSQIEERAKVYQEERTQQKQDRIKVQQIVKKDFKQSDSIWKEINAIPACELACEIWGVSVSDRGLDNVALKEAHKNMGAYWYRPHNIIVNTGSSLIKTDKSCFTTYELVYYEMMGGDKRRTIEYFKDRYGLEFEEKNTGKIEIPKKDKLKVPEGFVFPSEVFDELGCIQTGELVTIVAEGHSGKTTFALDMIQANAKRGKRGYYMNLEFPIRTMWESRWLFINGKKKSNLNDIDPMSEEERDSMEKYIQNKLNQFDYLDNPGGIELTELMKHIIDKSEKGYKLFVVDSFSKTSNANDEEYKTQKTIMLKLQELVQSLQICVVLLHHTNKSGDFAGTKKIFDDSNVFMTISKGETEGFEEYRTFTLQKDKITKIGKLNIYFIDHKYTSEQEYFGKNNIKDTF